jgi:Domain of unknown function (DUF6379)
LFDAGGRTISSVEDLPSARQTTFRIDEHPHDLLPTAVREHWNFDDEAILHVAKPGGLEPGWHEIEFQQSVLAAYGYHPTDEEWVRNPPKPGLGAGSDKTPVVMTRLRLNDSEG